MRLPEGLHRLLSVAFMLTLVNILDKEDSGKAHFWVGLLMGLYAVDAGLLIRRLFIAEVKKEEPNERE